jgi:glycerol-3-phosphate acyltransferase PlsY
MNDYTIIFGLLGLAYLSGSIPFGLLIPKIFKKIDIRKFGSGNIGSTNVTRVMGKKWGAVVLLLDGLKGVIPILIAQRLFPFGGDLIPVLVGITAVLGHIFPIFLKFKGGKGVATTIAVLFTLDWVLGLCLIAVWYPVFKISKIVAVASLVAILTTTLIATFIASFEVMMMCAILTLIIIIKHKGNIQRILAGKENVFKKK